MTNNTKSSNVLGKNNSSSTEETQRSALPTLSNANMNANAPMNNPNANGSMPTLANMNNDGGGPWWCIKA